MSDPKWITQREIARLHTKLIDQTGGSHGLRDSSLLESALARPRNLHAYGEQDIFQLAASYAEGLSRNHAFVDGNKRIGFSAADTFLFNNGQELLPRKDDGHVHMMETLAQGHMSREAAAQHFKDNCRAIEQEKSTAREEPPKKDWNKNPERPRTMKKAPTPRRDPDRSR